MLKRGLLLVLVWILLCFQASAASCGNGVCEPFGFGVEYVQTDVASYYGSLGAAWAKPRGIIGAWNLIEPNAPINDKHQYDFSLLDTNILAWQKSGHSASHIWVKLDADWAIIPLNPKCNRPGPSRPLKLGQEKNLHDFVYSLVERYDMDGAEDLSGLRYPVTHFEILSEAQHNGQFCVPDSMNRMEEYEKILKISHNAAKQANPDVNIVLSGITAEQVFNGFPTLEESAGRLNCLGNNWMQQMDFVQQSLKLTDYYDIVEFHSIEDPPQLYGFMRWLRDGLKVTKPVWVGDAWPITPITPPGKVCSPVTYLNGNDIMVSVDRVMMERYDNNFRPSPMDRQVEKWYRKRQAGSVVQKAVIAADAGYSGIMMGNTHDWYKQRFNPLRYHDAAWMGLAQVDDATLADNFWDNKEMKVEYARPAFYAYQSTIEELDGFKSVEKIGVKEGVYLYRFDFDGSEKFVAWYDDHIGECPICSSTQEGSTSVDVSEYVSTKHVKITHIVTELDSSNSPIYPPNEIVPANSVKIDETPIFVEETGAPPPSPICGNGICEDGETKQNCPDDCGSGNPGDVNGDGVVNIFDLVIVAQNFGMNPCPGVCNDPRADVNSDGVVNIFDLVIVAQNFGRSS